MTKYLSILSLLILLGMYSCSGSSQVGSPSSDGDLDESCPAGTEGCPCYDDGTCVDGLKCRQNACVSDDPGLDGDLDTPDDDRSSEGEFDEVELSESDLDDVNDTDGDLEGDSENGGFENDEDSSPDGDLDSESDEGDTDRVDSDPDPEREEDSEIEADPDVDPDPEPDTESEESVDEDQDPEETDPPECEGGPCCSEGEWLSVGSDCLQETDDFSCTDDVCDADHDCVHPIQDGFCLIGGTCYVHHENHPDNECRWCDSETNGWASKPESETCNDSDPCTYGDHCDGGTCGGTPIVCEDGPGICGADRSCDGSNTCVVAFPDNATSCESDGKDCTDDHCDGSGICLHDRIETMCLIGDTCFADGQWNPDDSCQKCDSASNEWVPKETYSECDDGNPCTKADYCDSEGVCQGAIPYSCAPAECQESSECDGEGGCSVVDSPDDTPCGNDGLCTGPNVCLDGSCERTWAVGCEGHGVCLPDTGGCDCLDNFTGSDCGQCEEGAPGVYPNCGGFEATERSEGLWPVTPTGQTACYGEWYRIPCPGEAGGSACSITQYCGQDGQYQDIPRAIYVETVMGDPVVVESVTGFVWTQISATSTMSRSDAVSFCSGLTYAGYSDWKLPTAHEWITLLEFGGSKSLDPVAFPDSGGVFWTSTVVDSSWYEGYGWFVNTGSGALGWSDRDTGFNVRCVRNHPSWSEAGFESRYVYQSSVIFDLGTGLHWQRWPSIDPTDYSWEDTLSYCESATIGGYTDWRLPNVKELWSIVKFNEYDPASTFPSMPSEVFWSSTSDPYEPRYAKAVDFETGQTVDKTKTEVAGIRCVR